MAKSLQETFEETQRDLQSKNADGKYHHNEFLRLIYMGLTKQLNSSNESQWHGEEAEQC